MKNIVLFGSGRSASSLIKYLSDRTNENQIQLHIADQSIDAIQQKIEHNPNVFATALDIHNENQRQAFIEKPTWSFRCCPLFCTR